MWYVRGGKQTDTTNHIISLLHDTARLINMSLMRVPKSTQCYQVFACMTAMLLDHRLDSARQVHSSITLQPLCLKVKPLYQCV